MLANATTDGGGACKPPVPTEINFFNNIMFSKINDENDFVFYVHIKEKFAKLVPRHFLIMKMNIKGLLLKIQT